MGTWYAVAVPECPLRASLEQSASSTFDKSGKRAPHGSFILCACFFGHSAVPSARALVLSRPGGGILFVPGDRLFGASHSRTRARVRRSRMELHSEPQCLYYIYKESCTRALGANTSRRISLHEKRKIGDETVVTCPRNTLVVANTCGVCKEWWEGSASHFTFN